MSTIDLQALSTIAASLAALGSLIVSIVVLRSQKETEREFKSVLTALVAASLVGTEQSVGETLLRFLRLTKRIRHELEPEGIRLVIKRAYEAGNMRLDDYKGLSTEMPELFRDLQMEPEETKIR